MAEVSAGGGTIAWIDKGGALRVGPLSAGSDPGPAAYGKGGDKATITDANYILGRLPDKLAGGNIKLDKDLSMKAIKELSDKLGLDIVETAKWIIEISNSIMGRALRLVTVDRGFDPRDFVLVAFGGAGPLHAVDLAEELDIKEIIVPPYPGLFSSLGLLVSDYKINLQSSIVKNLNEVSIKDMERRYREMEEKAIAYLVREGIKEGDIKIIRTVDMTYKGQAYELNIPYIPDLEKLKENFNLINQARYGFQLDEDQEMISIRIEVIGITKKPVMKCIESEKRSSTPYEEREIYFDEWIKSRIFKRERLAPGMKEEGPLLIESDDTTILIPPNYQMEVDCYNIIHIKGCEYE